MGSGICFFGGRSSGDHPLRVNFGLGRGCSGDLHRVLRLIVNALRHEVGAVRLGVVLADEVVGGAAAALVGRHVVGDQVEVALDARVRLLDVLDRGGGQGLTLGGG